MLLGLLFLLLPVSVLDNRASVPDSPVSATYRLHDGFKLPDPAVTPGAIAITDTEAVCHPKIPWGQDHRFVTPAMKAEAYRLYGVAETFHIVLGKRVPDTTRKDACCEVDHLVARSLGGADSQANLWVQPWHQARQKDRLENRLHAEVCRIRVPALLQDLFSWTRPLKLALAQSILRGDWYAAYKDRFGDGTP